MNMLNVKTPLGPGVFQQGRIYAGSETRLIVRLPVNDKTTPHLKDENCLTPHAQISGMWWFPEAAVTSPA